MKYYTKPISVSIDEICSEAFNIEAGRTYSQNGEIIENLKDSAPYPRFTNSKVTTTIKCHCGFIFVPEKIIESFSNLFQSKLFQISEKYFEKTGKRHLKNASSLEIGAEHFISLKAKNNLRDHVNYNYVPATHHERAIIKNLNGERVDRLISKSRFTWVISSTEFAILSINQYQSRSVHLLAQAIGIYFDPDNKIKMEHGAYSIQNLTFYDYKACQKILPLTRLGLINDSFVERHKKTGNQAIQDFLTHHQELSKFPEYIPGWDLCHTLFYCDKRKSAFEIIRNLGNPNCYGSSTYVPILNLTNQIYEVPFKDIKINNSLFLPGTDNNICVGCCAPLYDAIYVVVSDLSRNVGYAICHVCAHVKFFDRIFISFGGEPLFRPTDILAKTIYPRTVNDVIDTIDTDHVVKFILKSFHAKNWVDLNYNGHSRAVHLNFKGNNPYIGWCGMIPSFVSYVYDNYSEFYTKFTDQAEAFRYITSVPVIPLNYVSY